MAVQDGVDGSIDVTYNGPIATLQMNRGQNRINPDLVEKMVIAINEVESHEEIECLIITGTGKYFSNGMDLEYSRKSGDVVEAVQIFDRLLLTILKLPLITVAAINGHAYAGGMFLALSCDIRIMNSEQGWMCLNEARIGLPLASKYFTELFRIVLPSAQVVREAAVLAKIYNGEQAMSAGIVQQIYSQDKLLTGAHEYAHTFLVTNKKYKLDRSVMGANKAAICEPVVAAFEEHLKFLFGDFKSNM